MIENEAKYILKQSDGLENKIRRLSHEQYFINQGYLVRSKGMTVRIRKQRKADKVKYVMAVKTRVGERVIEIEKNISEIDYKYLSEQASGWVEKIRYVIGQWEIDFFKSGKETYFVMAEVELPDGVKYPSKVPDFVMDCLLYTVPREDCRFSSKKLSDVEYAKQLLKEL